MVSGWQTDHPNPSDNDWRIRAKRSLVWLAGVSLAAIVGYFVVLPLGPLNNVLFPGADPGEDNWPDGKSAWTVILASEQTCGQAESAVEQTKRVPSGGLSLGVLHSDDYASWKAASGLLPTNASLKKSRLEELPQLALELGVRESSR